MASTLDDARGELIAFFRGEGYGHFGWNGDEMGWTPEHCAVEAMRELMRLKTRAAPVPQCDAVSVRPSDPRVIIAGIRRFGLASDGSDLRDLEAALVSPPSEAGREMLYGWNAKSNARHEVKVRDYIDRLRFAIASEIEARINFNRGDDVYSIGCDVIEIPMVRSLIDFALSRPDQGTVAVSSADRGGP